MFKSIMGVTCSSVEDVKADATEKSRRDLPFEVVKPV